MKKITSIALAFVIILAGAVAVFASGELVSNGDFPTDISDWELTAVSGVTAEIDGGCGAGVVKITADGASGGLQQCIPLELVTTAAETEWTLSADIRLISGTSAGISAGFFENPNCAGGSPAYTIAIDPATTTPSGSLAPFTTTDSYTRQVNSSVLITLNAVDPSVACFDNISLVAVEPAAVTLASVDAQSAAPSPWALVLAVALGVIVVASGLLARQRAA